MKFIIKYFIFITIAIAFIQCKSTQQVSLKNNKENKIDEIYQRETSFVNSLPYAEEFHKRYEVYLKKNIRLELAAIIADAFSAFGAGMQGRTADQNVMASSKLKNERKKIYEDWINEIRLRSELATKTESSSSKNLSRDIISTNNELAKTVSNSPTLHIYGGENHDVYLGCLNCDNSNSSSIWNEYGTYGNSYNTDCIWNEYGTYGNEYSQYSPWNTYATYPPVIVDKEGNFYGYFTKNINKEKRADFDLVLILYKYNDLIRENVSKWYDKIFEE
jgi:hypothetical protein